MAANNSHEEEKLAERVKKMDINDEKKFSEGEKKIDKEDEDTKTCNVILHQIDAPTQENKFLEKLVLQVKQDNLTIEVKGVEGEVGHQSYDLSKLEEVLKNLDKSKKVILAFPDKEIIEAQLIEIVNKILERGQHFVTIIMYNDIHADLPLELAEFKLRRIEVDRDLEKVDVKTVASDLCPFIKDEPKIVDLAFMNAGTGLAWSYYFGYLKFILPEFETHIKDSEWRENRKDILEENISKTMLIVFSTDCREPKAMKSERVKFYINKLPLDRAGLRRNYDFDFREIVSKDGTKSHYGVVYHLNVIQTLREMRDDCNKEFVDLSDEMMIREGKYCFERLKLFLKYAEKTIDSSKYKLIEHNSNEENADEKLTDRLFDCLKEVNEKKPEVLMEVKQEPKSKIGVLFLERNKLPANVQDYLKELKEPVKMIDESGEKSELVWGDEIIQNSERILMVLQDFNDDDLATSYFDNWFYKILDYNLRQEKDFDRRSLVVLDCRKNPISNNLHLFSYVSHKDKQWKKKVTIELNGEPQQITHDLVMYLNIGTGLALSWYYRYLKIRVPKVVDVIRQCPALLKKFKDGLMSYKVFFLHPESCHCPGKVTASDPRINQVNDKEIDLPHIMKDERDYTPKVHSIIDNSDKKEYYVIVEYNTQAETLHRMMDDGFLTETLMLSEWQRFFNQFKTLICHPQEPMKLIERLKTIEYNDKDPNMKPDGALAELLLKHVKYEIKQEKRTLPEEIDNGATIEMRDWEKKRAAAGDAKKK